MNQPTNRIYCNRCKQTTNHNLTGQHAHSERDEFWWETTTYRLWICAGCESGTLEQAYTDISMDAEVDTTFYPKRMHGDLSAKGFVKLKPKLRQIYKEAIQCFNSGSLLLCTAGLRALLEGVCDDRRVRRKNLRQKIDNLQPYVGKQKYSEELASLPVHWQ